MAGNLYRLISESRDPWVIAEQKRILRENDNYKYGQFLIENYDNDEVCRTIVESYRKANPSESRIIDDALYSVYSINEDGFEPASAKEKKGGFFSKLGDWAKKATRTGFDFIYGMKKGIFGDKEADQAQAEYDKILQKYDKVAGKTVKTVFDEIKERYPNFPNTDGKDAEEAIRRNDLDPDLSPHAVFINGLLLISSFYDTVVKQHSLYDPKSKKQKEGVLTTDQANEIIADLRALTNKLSKDLSAVYTRFKESDQRKTLASQLFERESSSLDIKSDEDTDATKGMKNKTFEKILAAIGLGALVGAAGLKIFAALKSTLASGGGTTEVTRVLESIVGNVQPGEGLTQILQKFTGINLGPSATGKDFLNALSQMGGGDPALGAKMLAEKSEIFQNESGAKQVLDRIISDRSSFDNVKLVDIFKETWAGTGKTAGDLLVTKAGGAIVKGWTTRLVVAAGTAVAGATASTAALAVTAGALATPLAIFGAGVLVVGAASYWLKQKGLKSSRSAAIQGLISIMKDVEGPTMENPTAEIPSEDDKKGKEKGKGKEEKGGGEESDKCFRVELHLKETKLEIREVEENDDISRTQLNKWKRKFASVKKSSKSWIADREDLIEKNFWSSIGIDKELLNIHPANSSILVDGISAISNHSKVKGGKILLGVSDEAYEALSSDVPELAKPIQLRKILLAFAGYKTKQIPPNIFKQFVKSEGESLRGQESLNIPLDDEKMEKAVSLFQRMGVVGNRDAKTMREEEEMNESIARWQKLAGILHD